MSGVEISDAGGTTVIRLDRPKALNALTEDDWRSLLAAVTNPCCRESRGVVITGTGRAFSAGMEIGEIGRPRQGEGLLTSVVHPAVRALVTLPVPLVALVNGVTAGAAIGIALAADHRIGTPQTSFVAGFARQGLVPDAGTSWFLPRLIGDTRATRFLLGNDRMDAARAEELGLVDEVVDDDGALERAITLAQELSSTPPVSLEQTLRLTRAAKVAGLEEFLYREREAQELALAERRQRVPCDHAAESSTTNDTKMMKGVASHAVCQGIDAAIPVRVRRAGR